ncbi:MAG: serine/threonine protein phosphatase [Clostridiales bacterium]|nr:MAG: serine/threonine protein phosphatase [Clostridiales bacterium]
MKIYAISDLHLSLDSDKPMDIFGDNWVDHWGSIRQDWLDTVSEDDLVISAGDISWAMDYAHAKADLDAVCAMPGSKILIRGNHDYWHSSLKKTNAYLHNRTYFLQNNAIALGGYVFVGARGWKQKGETDFSAEDSKIYAREVNRLELSLKAAQKLEGERIGIMHYPPFTQDKKPSEFTQLYTAYGVKTVIYGHLHGKKVHKAGLENLTIEGTHYLLTSCDQLDFKLLRVR